MGQAVSLVTVGRLLRAGATVGRGPPSRSTAPTILTAPPSSVPERPRRRARGHGPAGDLGGHQEERTRGRLCQQGRGGNPAVRPRGADPRLRRPSLAVRSPKGVY